MIALVSSAAQANNSSEPFVIIDMTSTSYLGGGMVVTTGFLHELDFVVFEEPTLSIAPDGISFDLTPQAESGWSGLVEVETYKEPSLSYENVSSFSHSFATPERETEMRGFYTMRYSFETDLPFRPYAGAGLGLVATDSATQTEGVFAGRATAGFDFAMDDQSAFFAEYSFVKSGGVSLGIASNSAVDGTSIADTEHALKLGFRHTF